MYITTYIPSLMCYVLTLVAPKEGYSGFNTRRHSNEKRARPPMHMPKSPHLRLVWATPALVLEYRVANRIHSSNIWSIGNIV